MGNCNTGCVALHVDGDEGTVDRTPQEIILIRQMSSGQGGMSSMQMLSCLGDGDLLSILSDSSKSWQLGTNDEPLLQE